MPLVNLINWFLVLAFFSISTTIRSRQQQPLIVFSGNVILTNNFQYHSQFVNTGNITW